MPLGFTFYVGIICGYSNNFHFDPSTVKVHFSYVDRVEKHGYFFEGKKELIDVEEEWFFEPKDSMLYLYAADGKNPNDLNIEGKIMSYALEFSNSSLPIITLLVIIISASPIRSWTSDLTVTS